MASALPQRSCRALVRGPCFSSPAHSSSLACDASNLAIVSGDRALRCCDCLTGGFVVELGRELCRQEYCGADKPTQN